MHLAPPSRRVLGLAAAGALAFGFTAIASVAVAQAASLDALDITTDSGSGGTLVTGSYTIPTGYCSVDWQLYGAGGGAGYDSTSGGLGNAAPGGYLAVTTPVAAGQVVFLVTGMQGGDGSASGHGAGGTGAAAGGVGTDQLDTGSVVGGGGGGGGATAVSLDALKLVARGGDGGEADGSTPGGAGGNGASNTVSWAGATTATDDSAGGNTGDGLINGTVKPCPEGPGAPTGLSTTGGDHQATINFSPDPDTYADSWQYSLDGGAWKNVTVHGDYDHWFTLTGLTNGRSYSVRVRGLDGATAGTASTAATVTPAAPNGAPTHVVVTPGPSSYVVTWDRPHTGGTFPIAGYVVAYNGGQMGGPLCENVPVTAARRCVGAAVPGAKYQVQVWAVDTKGNWGVPSALLPVGKVSAPAVPAAPPASKDHLELPAGADSAVSAGATMKLSGHGYLPNSTVSVIIYSSPRVLTSVVTDETGSFEVTVTVPERLKNGHHTLVASGVDPSGTVRYVTLPVTVSGGTAGSGTSGGGDLAYTGFDVALPVTIGLVALGVGGALMVAARRRKVTEPVA